MDHMYKIKTFFHIINFNVFEVILILMGNRFMWENRAGLNVFTFSESTVLIIPIVKEIKYVQ